MKKYIIYHANCTDGLTSAALFSHWIKSNAFQDAHNYEFIPGHFQMTRDDIKHVQGGAVIFVDFSFKKELFEHVLDIASSVVLIDHHKGAQDELQHLFNRENLTVVFDLNECGSSLTWKYLFPKQEMPLVIKHVRDRDIWKWEEKDSKEYLAALDTNEFTSESFTSFYSNYLSIPKEDQDQLRKEMIETGKILLTQKKNMTRVIMENIRYIDFLDYKDVAICNCNFLFTNDVSESLIDNGTVNVLITYQDSLLGRKFSIRTRKGFDAISLAQTLNPGGGGHPQASGTFIPFSDFSTHPFIKVLYSL